MKLTNIAAGILLAAGVATAAQATPIAGSFFPGQLNQLSDNNAEYLVNRDGSLSNAGDSILDQGDRLVGMFTIETIEALASGGQNNLNATGRELTGIFDITVVSKQIFAGPLGSIYSYTFAATDLAGTAVRLFDGNTQDYTRLDDGTGTRAARLAALMGTASNGLDFMTLGINKYWVATTNTDDIAAIGALPPGQAVNTFQASFDILTNNSGLMFDKVSCGLTPTGPLGIHTTDVCGSGSLLGTLGVQTPFDSFSNVDFTVKPIPEPASLALLGLGIFGIGAFSRKRKAS